MLSGLGAAPPGFTSGTAGQRNETGIDNGGETMNLRLQPAVFLDRDGVVNHVVMRDGVPHPPQHLDEFAFFRNAADSLFQLRRAGYPLIVVTNQPDVARGTQTRWRVEEIN